MPRAEVLALFGPTAVGKSALAHAAALELGGEIIVADPFQRYRGLEIAADAPSERERAEVPYHFVGDLELTDASSMGEYADLASARIADVLARGRVPLVAGGSGLYVRGALAELEFAPRASADVRASVERLVANDPHAAKLELGELDPEAGRRVDTKNPRRLARALEIARSGGSRADELWTAPYRRPSLLVGVDRPSEYLLELIAARVHRELRDGLVAEIETAIDTPGLSREAAQIIGVKEVRQLREGTLAEADLPERLTSRTRRLAYRQSALMRLLAPQRTIDLETYADPLWALPTLLKAWGDA